MNIYIEKGYESRKHYLKELALDFDVSKSLVFAAADLLGPTEDFDGLLTMIEDLYNVE